MHGRGLTLLLIAAFALLGILPSTWGLSAQVASQPVDDELGVPIPMPPIETCLSIPADYNEGWTVTAACAAASAPDAVCPVGWPPATGENTGCEKPFEWHKLKTIIQYYGGTDATPENRTTGSNHAYAYDSHEDHGVFWWVNWSDGRPKTNTNGECGDLTQRKWDANTVAGGLSEDTGGLASCWVYDPTG